MSPIVSGSIDVAQLVLVAFTLFFIGLIFYLRREDRREGYPLEDDATGRIDSAGGILHTGSAKTFNLPFGRGTVTAPTKGREPVNIAARRIARFPGAPLVPTGNPLVDGIGPAAFAERAQHPDLDMEGHPRIVPLRSQPDFFFAARDPNPIGMTMLGSDGRDAGTVSDAWIDKADRLIRYLEVSSGGRTVLVPMTMTTIDRRRRIVKTDSIAAAQFADAPGASGDTITLYEEERVVAYFGGGYLYSSPARSEPWL